MNKNIKYKKFLVVADSLPDLIALLTETLGESIYSEYFLIIDEIDSFQSDSTFRTSLELCLDVYKKFDLQNRILITATLLRFTDPDLQNESTTNITYEFSQKRKLTLVHTSSLELLASEKIFQLQSNSKEEKIVIACSHFETIRKIITDIEKSFNINPSKIKILCSANSDIKAGDYLGELENGILPGEINFITSAYYTGVDINECYHSITVASYRIPYTMLSTDKLKQIVGRCRKSIYSETVIFSSNQFNEKIIVLNFEELKEIALTQIEALNCIQIQYALNPHLKYYFIQKKKDLSDITDYFGYKLVRKNLNGNFVISYFNIDAFLENQNTTVNLYNDHRQLFDQLSKEEGNDVDFLNYDSKRAPKNYGTQLDLPTRDRLKEIALELLSNIQDFDDLENLRREVKSPGEFNNIFDMFESLLPFFSAADALEKVNNFGFNKKEFYYYKESLNFVALHDEDSYKQAILQNFQLGEVLLNKEIQERLSKIFTALFLDLTPIDTPTKAIRLFNCYFETNDRKERGHKIIGLNPKKIDVKQLAWGKKNGMNFIDFDKIDVPIN